MKYLIVLLLVGGCADISVSRYRCDNKVGVEKEQCLEAYDNYTRNLDYVNFRGGGNDY